MKVYLVVVQNLVISPPAKILRAAPGHHLTPLIIIGCFMRLPSGQVAGAIAAAMICSQPYIYPSPLAAEPPPFELTAALLAADAPTAAALALTAPSSPDSDDARRVEGSVRAIVATAAEAKELKQAADKLSLPSVPTDSDLGKLLSGEFVPPGAAQSPRASGSNSGIPACPIPLAYRIAIVTQVPIRTN